MSIVRRSVLLSLVLGLSNVHALASQSDYAAPIMAGISNQGQHQSEPYVTAGDRAYLIGSQDGNFPDMGEHVPGEMGGLWLHPIKLIDGFWGEVTDMATHQEVALSKAAELVTYPYGSRFRYGRALDSLEIERFQFSPDGHQGVIVQYQFKNESDRKRRLKFQLSVKTDLRPVWLSEQLGIEDAQDSVAWQATSRLFIASDGGNPWFSVWGALHSPDAQPVAAPPPIRTRGKGVTAASRYNLSIDRHGTAVLTFVIAGSATAKAEALEAFGYLSRNHSSLLAAKKRHYAAIVTRARVSIPDRRLQEVYNWVRINAEWLVRDVPGIGRGLGAGLMEYPWWFGTETYSLQALAATGDFDLAARSLRLLKNQSMRANGNGRILHELTTNGGVSNPGNTQETAQFILTVGKLVEGTGDLAFAKEMYPAMKLGIDWLLTDMDRNKNLFPEGYGITEILGLNAELIDVAAYTQEALEATARVAAVLNDPDAAERYRQLASRVKVKINESFWLEDEGSYADFFGSKAQAISAADGAIRQIGLQGEAQLTPRDRELMGYYEQLKRKFSALPDTTRGWLTSKNWVITTPLETGIAPRARAIRFLDKIRRENVGEYGPFLSAVDRQAMMTISTGVQAVSEANYGRTEEALWYVDKIVQTFNRTTPGSISEMMPDYGCFAIAWTSYGIVLPLIRHIFGIQPDAINKTVVFDPHVPAGWKNMSIEDLPVGRTLISFSRAETSKGIEFDFQARNAGWHFLFKGNEVPGARYYLNGRPVSLTSAGIRMSGRTNHLVAVR
jgi:glycogen debranching enzyme